MGRWFLDLFHQFDAIANHFVIPVAMARMFMAGKALRLLMILTALRTIAAGLKGVPAMAAITEPAGILLRLPRALWAVDAYFSAVAFHDSQDFTKAGACPMEHLKSNLRFRNRRDRQARLRKRNGESFQQQMKTAVLLYLSLLAFAPSLFGKAYYYSESELVLRSEAIAVIDLREPTVSDAKGAHWQYRKKAAARRVELISGSLPEEFDLHGAENYICASCDLKKGRYLAFLKRDGELWAGSNWNLSLRPVQDGKIEWYSSPDVRHPMAYLDESHVRRRVNMLLGKPDLSVGVPFPKIPLAKIDATGDEPAMTTPDFQAKRTVVHIFAGW